MDPAAIINHDAVANILHVRKQMAAQDDGLSASGQGQDQIFDLAATDRVEAGGGFVQNDQVGVIDQRLGQADAALHAFGEFTHHPAPHLVESDHLQELFGAAPALVVRQIKQAAEKIEGFARIQIAVEVRFFGQIADARFGGDMPW